MRIGGGADVLDVYRDLVLAHERALPVGTCPTVGIAGLTLGGGFGRLMRRYGVTADSLRGGDRRARRRARRALLAGRSGADLFWALRGGGAGFAIVTQLRFAVRAAPAGPIAFTLSYPWTQAAAAIDAWQRTLPARADDARLRAPARAAPARRRADADRLGPLVRQRGVAARAARAARRGRPGAPDAAPAHVRAGRAARQRHAARRPAGARRGAALPQLPALGLLRGPAAGAGDRRARRRRSSAGPGVGGRGHEGGVQLDALGGAVNRPAAGATAFVHRAQRMHCAYLSFWGASDPAPMAAACAQWVRDTQALLAPHASGFGVPELHRSRAARAGSRPTSARTSRG